MLNISYEGAEESGWIWIDFLIEISKGNSLITYIQCRITWLDINSAALHFEIKKDLKSFFWLIKQLQTI